MYSMKNAYGLVVGIANYRNVRPLPEGVLKDAQDIYNVLIAPDICAYPRQNVQLLLDGEATGATMRQALATLAQRCCRRRHSLYIFLRPWRADRGWCLRGRIPVASGYGLHL